MVQRILYFREMDHELLAEHEIDYCVLSCIDRPFAMNENEIEGNGIFDKRSLVFVYSRTIKVHL